MTKQKLFSPEYRKSGRSNPAGLHFQGSSGKKAAFQVVSICFQQDAKLPAGYKVTAVCFIRYVSLYKEQILSFQIRS